MVKRWLGPCAIVSGSKYLSAPPQHLLSSSSFLHRNGIGEGRRKTDLEVMSQGQEARGSLREAQLHAPLLRFFFQHHNTNWQEKR
jgi:hypothetical protein